MTVAKSLNGDPNCLGFRRAAPFRHISVCDDNAAHYGGRLLSQEDMALYDRGELAELLYADYTLPLSVTSRSLERYLAAVRKAGSSFGLELHPHKYQLM